MSYLKTFKDLMIKNIIPRVEAMKEKERLHLHYLINNDAPKDFIAISQKNHNHFTQRIIEYKKYAKGAK